MKEILGHSVYDTLDELADPSHTAVIVVDMQNDLCDPEGLLSKGGENIAGNRRIIEPLRVLLDAAREAKVPIIYIQYVVEKSLATVAPAYIHYWYRERPTGGRNKMPLQVCVEDTWGHETIPELAPQSGDIIVRKNRNGAFWATRLDQVLRSNGIESVVVTGTATTGCVLETAIGAYAHDYYVLMAQDCITMSNHEKHDLGVKLLLDRYDSPMSEELITTWAAAKQAA